MKVKKEHIGLRTYLYTFNLEDRAKFDQYKTRLKKTGKVTEVFLNNKYGLEHKIPSLRIQEVRNNGIT